MAKKNNYQIGGFEAPRNSLELLANSFQSCYAVREYEACKYAVRQNMSKNSSFSANASMKKLISDEISKGSVQKQRSPSIVARLMGMEVFPSDTESVDQPFELNDGTAKNGGLQRQHRDNLSPGNKYLQSSDKHMYSHLLINGTDLGKPRQRLHPQEKELEQFKRDFAAWQSSRFAECARVADLENISEQKDKMVCYKNARRSAHQKPKISTGADQEYCDYRKSSLFTKKKKSHGLRTKSMDREFEELSVIDFDKRSSKSSGPAKIVILKPGPDSFSSNDESWASSSASVDDRDCIEDLLEEVKERINHELQGKFCRRGGGNETPFKVRSSCTSQRARDLKIRIRENTSVNHPRHLLGSKSTRSYRSEAYQNDDDSPDFMRQDAKQLFCKQLRSVINGENQHNIQKVMNYSSSSIDLDDTRGRLEQVRNILNAANRWENWNESNNGDYYPEATSFRHDYSEEETSEGESSPRNLVRSLSAPVSGTSFGKLLLEDRHILTGAQVRRKHEALKCVRVDGEDQKKERIKFSEKVSNIKCNLTLKGKLFSGKFHSFDLSKGNEYELIKDINSGPTVLLNLPDKNENYTEVPPSPASVCSTTPEEPSQPAEDHTSTIPASDITSLEDPTADNTSREINPIHNDMNTDFKRIDSQESEVTTITEEPLEVEMVDLEGESETYIRNVLVASGLYKGSSRDSSSILNPYEKLIDDQVFEKVEETYINSNEREEDNNHTLFSHRVLFDLLNEALYMVLKPPKSFTGFQRNTISATLFRPPQGKSLLQRVWTIISQHTNPSEEHDFPSLEDMVSHDLDFVLWFDLIDEELKTVSSDVEALITSELIEEAINGIAS